MKTIEINQLALIEGGDFWTAAGCIGGALAWGASIAGATLLTGGVGGALLWAGGHAAIGTGMGIACAEWLKGMQEPAAQ